MALQERRLFGPVAGTGAEATLYTSTNRAKVLFMQICNTTTSDQTFKMSIGADAAGVRLFSTTKVPASATEGGVATWTGVIPLEKAETLRWNAPTSLTIFGYGLEF